MIQDRKKCEASLGCKAKETCYASWTQTEFKAFCFSLKTCLLWPSLLLPLPPLPQPLFSWLLFDTTWTNSTEKCLNIWGEPRASGVLLQGFSVGWSQARKFSLGWFPGGRLKLWLTPGGLRTPGRNWAIFLRARSKTHTFDPNTQAHKTLGSPGLLPSH